MSGNGRLLRNLSFGLFGLITICLAAATIVEKYHGAAAAASWFYVSPWMKELWAVATVLALVYLYLCMRRRGISRPGMMLHLSLVLILLGALATSLTGRHGTMKLQEGTGPQSRFTLDNGGEGRLPFRMALDTCGVEYYPGTSAARDYYSEVTVDGHRRRISMNRVLNVRGYRFYQSAMGEDYTVLTVNHDPLGIGVSYAGYVLLAVSMVWFMCARDTRFRRLARRVTVVAVLLAAAGSATAQDRTPVPQTVDEQVARAMGRLYVYWNDRVAPMETMARDFCLKTYGKTSYRGLDAMQVMAGWLFYYDDWKREPMIRVRGEAAVEALGVGGGYAALTDFYDRNGYKLEGALRNAPGDVKLLETDERVNLVTMVCTGSGIRLGAPARKDGAWEALSEGGAMSRGMDVAARELMHGRSAEAVKVLGEIRDVQKRTAPPGVLPDERKVRMEIMYDRMGTTLPCAIVALVAGLVAYALFCARDGRLKKWGRRVIAGVALLLLCWLTALIAARWVIGGHIPLANGYETMLAMAWLSLLIAILAGGRLGIVLPAGMTVSGFALMVSVMGQNNPAVSHLMPVLQSPLLSSHVMVIMTAYALFAIMMLDSVAALVMRRDKAMVERLADISSMLLYPAVFLLALGIFIGAVWANQSWGRYWGWDSKETWALITLMVYSWPLHGVSFPWFGRAQVRHWYFMAAFVTVLFTYFGVNYLLGGMHSYA